MTKEEYVDAHRAMWQFIVDRIKASNKCLDIYELKAVWCSLNNVYPRCCCFACEWSYKLAGYNTCSKCLFRDKSTLLNKDYKCLDGRYFECVVATHYTDQLRLAEEIRDLKPI